MIRLNPGVSPPPTPAGPVKRDWYTLMGAFASAFATPACTGDHEGITIMKPEEPEWKRS